MAIIVPHCPPMLFPGRRPNNFRLSKIRRKWVVSSRAATFARFIVHEFGTVAMTIQTGRVAPAKLALAIKLFSEARKSAFWQRIVHDRSRVSRRIERIMAEAFPGPRPGPRRPGLAEPHGPESGRNVSERHGPGCGGAGQDVAGPVGIVRDAVGAQGETRTRTTSLPADFESAASTIPPLGHSACLASANRPVQPQSRQSAHLCAGPAAGTCPRGPAL